MINMLLPILMEAVKPVVKDVISRVGGDTQRAERELELEMAKLSSADSDNKLYLSIQRTIRAELDSGNKFKSCWRPFIGWVAGATFLSIALSLVLTVWNAVGAVGRGDSAGAVALYSGLSSLLNASVWLIASMAAILGINIKERTASKALGMGVAPPPSLFGSLAEAVGGRKRGGKDD